MVPSGTRAGMRDGDLLLAVEAMTELESGFPPRTVPPGVLAFPTGVLAPERFGGADRTVLPARDGAADAGGLVGTVLVLVGGGKPDGVFERGGGARAAAA